MIRNLNTKIITLFTIILLTATIIASWSGGSMFVSQYSGALKDKVLVIGQDLKLQLDRLLALEIPLEDLMGFEEQCQQIVTKYPDISFAGVVTTDGKILFHNDFASHKEYLRIPVLLKAFKKDADQIVAYQEQGRRYYGFITSLYDAKGKHLGATLLSLPEKVITGKVFWVTVYSVAISFLIFLLSLLLIFYFLHLWITHPLEQLNQATKEIGAKGIEFFQSVDIISDDEMGELVDSFNSMAAELKKTTVSKEYLDSIISSMMDALIVLDFGARIRTVNQATLDMLHYSREELLHHSIGVLFPTHVLFQDEPFLGGISDSGLKNHETTFVSKLGEQIPVLLSSSVIKDGQDAIRYIVCTCKDITDRKRTEEALLKQTDKLTRTNAELQEFTYIVSHDLQEPLRKIIAFGDRLKTRCAALDEQSSDYLGRILNASTRMQILINDLLAYSRITTKAQPFTTVNLSQIVAEVLSDLEMRIEQTHGKVIMEDLPEIEADPTQIRQLFQNLIGNSLKFHRENVPPVIQVSSRTTTGYKKPASPKSRREYCEIAVADNGIGIEEKYFNRIFGVFQRLHGRDEYEGTGVGLAICQKIVEKHSGNIRVESQPGEGTKFLITLPLKQNLSAE